MERGPLLLDFLQGKVDDYIVPLFGPITTESVGVALGRVLKLSSDDPYREIRIYIMSGGGDIHPGFALIDTCRLIPNPVSTVGLGLIASMGAMILTCAGRKGRRFLAPSVEYMLHQPATGVAGSAADVEIASRHIVALRRRIREMLSEASGLTQRRIASLTQRDRWLTADEAIRFGLADGILDAENRIEQDAKRPETGVGLGSTPIDRPF